MGLKQNTWSLDQWYDQNVAGNVTYSGLNELFMAGDNYYGNLGQNNKTKYSSPVQVPGTTWKKIGVPNDSRGIHATKTDGTLWFWGGMDNGSSGTNDQISRSSPIQIPGTTWDSLAVNTDTGMCTRTDGTLWIWGYGRYGMLGNNQSGNDSANNRSSPIQVGTETNWSQNIAISGTSAGGVKTDGTLWVWGTNLYGQLGQNNETQYSSPVQIPGTTWSTSDGHFSTSNSSLGIKTDGTLWTWGDNNYGQLGQNQPETSDRSSPVQIPGTNWSYVAAGQQNNFAVNTSGELYSWGWGDYGTNGQNNRTEYLEPEQVGSGTDWSKCFAGYNGDAAAAIKTDGTLWVWGNNEKGQLAQNNTTARYSSPTQIPGTWEMASPNQVISGYVSLL